MFRGVILLLLLNSLLVSCQENNIKINQSFGSITRVYLNKQNPDSSSFYYIAYEPQAKPKGIILLLPGYGEYPEGVANETEIDNYGLSENFVVAIGTLQDGAKTFYVDSLSQGNLAFLIRTLLNHYSLPQDKLILGGFSLGGAGAVKYAETAYLRDTSLYPKPKFVFGIDPPLDFARLYHSFVRYIKTGTNFGQILESETMIKKIEEEFQGTPYTNPNEYIKISPYSYLDTSAKNIKALKTAYLRLYSEPDLKWQMEERNRDIYDLNLTDCSAMINELRKIGSQKAELILTINKGVRQISGKKNPHSWSIVDARELLAKLNEVIK